jgi:hypothetical protein
MVEIGTQNAGAALSQRMQTFDDPGLEPVNP